MATNDDIRLVKGSYDVTLFTIDVSESIKNELKIVAGKGGTTSSKQSDGPKDTIVVDLLKITEAYHFETYITTISGKTAKSVKNELREIVKGAGIDGGEVTLYYEDSQIEGYIEDIVIKKVINDDVVSSSYGGYDSAEYQVTLDFIKGKKV